VENCKRWLREAYIKAVNNKCEMCGSKEDLQIHRIKRGNVGGEYIPSNCKVLCKKCHRRVHENEFKTAKSN